MRPLIMDPRLLRSTARDLDAAGTETSSALRAVEPPTQGYAWRQLVDRGVGRLLEDTQVLARGCRTIAEALEETLADVEATDSRAGATARGMQ